MADNKESHDKIELKIDSWVTRMGLGFETITQTLGRIEDVNAQTLKQVLKTNGRVTKVEDDLKDFKEKEYEVFKEETKKDLEIFSLLRRKKWIIFVFVLAAAQVYETINVVKIVKWITALFI